MIFRKGGKRVFNEREKALRQKSAYFYEERNIWFSDLWEITGTNQSIKGKCARSRNASFPVEIPYRLVNMYSIYGDTVLDPFAGLGTTNIACMLSNRNSVGVDIDDSIVALAMENMNISINDANKYIQSRISKHLDFIDSIEETPYVNTSHGFRVKTKQEIAIELQRIISIQHKDNVVTCKYGMVSLINKKRLF